MDQRAVGGALSTRESTVGGSSPSPWRCGRRAWRPIVPQQNRRCPGPRSGGFRRSARQQRYLMTRLAAPASGPRPARSPTSRSAARPGPTCHGSATCSPERSAGPGRLDGSSTQPGCSLAGALLDALEAISKRMDVMTRPSNVPSTNSDRWATKSPSTPYQPQGEGNLRVRGSCGL